MIKSQQPTGWRETIGLIDAVLDSAEPSSRLSWVNRYGQLKKGNQFVFSIDPVSEDTLHEQVIIAETEIGVQTSGYVLETNRFNEISYLPAYKFTRAAGGLALASVILSRDGELTIPLVRSFRDMLKPEDIIKDLHTLMCHEDAITTTTLS